MNNNMQSMSIPGASNFKFSAVRPDALGATEYTLVTIAVDVTGSVSGFEANLKAAVMAIIESSKKSPRADNLLIRLVKFNTKIMEVFGFKALADIDTSQIDDFDADGLTALYDASFEAISATEQYAQVLYGQDYDTNAAVYVITDGLDNRSQTATPAKIAKKISASKRDENLESLITMLIGVGISDTHVKKNLQEFANDGQFDQYIDIGDASASNLAKLAGFVSKSISLQSQSLGSGSASQSLTF